MYYVGYYNFKVIFPALLTQRAFPKSLPASSHLHCAGPQSAVMRGNLNLFIQLKFFTWKDWPWLPPSAISREGEELIRPSGGTPCRSPQTRDPLKMCFILNHSINYGVTFSSGFPSLEMKLFTYCKTSSWCFGKSLDKNQLYTKSEQILTQYLKKWISPVMRNLLTTLRRK